MGSAPKEYCVKSQDGSILRIASKRMCVEYIAERAMAGDCLKGATIAPYSGTALKGERA